MVRTKGHHDGLSLKEMQQRVWIMMIILHRGGIPVATRINTVMLESINDNESYTDNNNAIYNNT